ncbi:MAG: 8-oxo-dGTP diphosphatase [Actinomycetota bacterium]|nr:8-oxo-dGTP diphosphatase [Actinomycetota bacterium]
MRYSPVLTTLGFVLSEDATAVLMIEDTRPGSYGFGKWNGLGGKVAPDEDVVTGMRREIHEESGLTALELRLRGTVSWPGFGPDGEDSFGFCFVVDRWEGTPLTESAEGRLDWVPVADLLADPPRLDLWPGDRYFLPLVFGADERQFHGVLPYHDGRPTGWSHTWV